LAATPWLLLLLLLFCYELLLRLNTWLPADLHDTHQTLVVDNARVDS
jgi:hypothetical protein